MRLTVETGPLAGTVIPLDRDQPALLGSDPDCAVRLQEAGVSGQHAVVKALKGKGFGIKALSTDAAVKVNGAEVTASPLEDGDVIEVASTRIAFGQTQEHGLPTIPGYRIIDVLGQGGMGTVYRAEQVSLHRQVALKVLNETQTSDAAFVAKFIAEARAAAKLQHPNVVSVFDVEHDGDTYYYAMELMHSGSCEDWLRQNGVMPVDRALQVVADAAAGLAYAESLGIVHRDIKPDNLMLDQHGAIKIADLGLASTSSDSNEERAIGTPHFMAPEQVLNKQLDHRTDLYALGCTFYRLVTGKTPFRGQSVKDILRAQVKETAPPASKINPQVPAEVAEIIERLMAKEPADRYQTANELLEELEAMLQPVQKRGLWIGLAVVAVLAAGGAIYWAINKPKEKEVVTIKEKYDDPLTQEFADRIKVLEGEAKEKDAMIALLQVRVSGLDDEQLIQSLDGIASTHAGTAAASEATQLASRARQKVAAEKQRLQQLRQQVDGHLAKLRNAMKTPLATHDYAVALGGLDVAVPAAIAGEASLATGVDKLRAEIITKAKQRIEELRAALRTAEAGGNDAALIAAVEALEQGIEPDQRWPTAVQQELADAKAHVTAAQQAMRAARAAQLREAWGAYHTALTGSGFQQQLQSMQFAAAAENARKFAADAASDEARKRSQGLAEVVERAEAFAKRLAEACGSAEPEIFVGEDELRITGWDRAARKFEVRNLSNRRRKEELEEAALTPGHWLSLIEAAQLGEPTDDEPACFLSLVALRRHIDASTEYLTKVQAESDGSGTGDQAYDLAGTEFDKLLKAMPPQKNDWQRVLADELLGGQRLAAGLRALSEHRNLAAANHIDKLLVDHPHCLVVALLP